jgi:hypothetical protein
MAKADRMLSMPPPSAPVDTRDAAPFGKAALTFGGRTPSKPVTAG